jgi:hypothetical protein
MKNLFITIIIAAFFLHGCKKETPFDFTDTEENVLVYMPQAINQPNFKVSVFLPISASDPANTVVNFGAYFGGYHPVKEEIQATFEISPNGLTELNAIENAEGRTPYLLLPANMYHMETLTTSIKKGKNSSEILNLVIDHKTIPSGSKYALPISLNKVSNGFQISQKLKTTVFTFDVPDPWSKFAGNYKATGIFKHPVNGDRNIDLTAKIEYQGNRTFRAPLADLGGSNYYMLLKINDDNTVTISPSGVTPNIDQSLGKNTFDPVTQVFTLNYAYNLTAPRIVTQKFSK